MIDTLEKSQKSERRLTLGALIIAPFGFFRPPPSCSTDSPAAGAQLYAQRTYIRTHEEVRESLSMALSFHRFDDRSRDWRGVFARILRDVVITVRQQRYRLPRHFCRVSKLRSSGEITKWGFRSSRDRAKSLDVHTRGRPRRLSALDAIFAIVAKLATELAREIQFASPISINGVKPSWRSY